MTVLEDAARAATSAGVGSASLRKQFIDVARRRGDYHMDGADGPVELGIGACRLGRYRGSRAKPEFRRRIADGDISALLSALHGLRPPRISNGWTGATSLGREIRTRSHLYPCPGLIDIRTISSTPAPNISQINQPIYSFFISAANNLNGILTLAGSIHPPVPSKESPVSDLFYLFLGVGLFGLMTLYVRAAAKG